jgi:ASC-1-like (ASCH) protein
MTKTRRRHQMAEMTKEELEALITNVVQKVVSKRELETSGSTKDGDKIIFTSDKLKERLERAKKTAVNEMLEQLGVQSVDELKAVITTKQQAEQPKLEDKFKEAGIPEDKLALAETLYEGWKAKGGKGSIEEFLETAKTEYGLEPKAAETTSANNVPEGAMPPGNQTINIRDPKVPIETVLSLVDQME